MKGMKKIAGLALALAMMFSGVVTSATTLSTQLVVKGGLEATYTTVQSALTYTFRNNGRTILHFEKTGITSSVVTIVTQATVGGLAVADQTFTVDECNGDVFAGPFPRSLFEDSSGDITFTVTNSDAITVAAIQLPG